ncbi:MAG: hypothetical protein KKE30_11515 [Gammaproteobacteria bacterium]|nr:hypothetical protein [Gammaproteobacteria bacterium]MBU1556362.1 hypothetical protein [Gammaproteobacteria bacterium]MBU2069431.1 hypothetical protein [Gammaproteobacteria bacterium]MBU2182936.1 hypothetical protein [Gammaproteobacteria bacterium]MBU2203284.1 hypothetical protein [Gammaproteobacteria bacterium]
MTVTSATVFETEAITLTATAGDTDGSIAKYSWRQMGGTAVSISGGNTASINFTAPAVTVDQILSFQVTVTDNQGSTASATSIVTIKFNQPPVISLLDTAVDEKTAQTLTASLTDDGTIIAIGWQQTAGPAITLNGVDTATVSFTAPDVQADTELQFSVTATDNLGKTTTATGAVLVKTTDSSYRIKGVVTDSPIANAEVNTEVSGVLYTTTANANGEYVLDIKLATDAGDELIILTATSPVDEQVLFHSILGNAEDIRTAAGGDSTLTNTELFATNITNVSSAHYALVVQANNGNVPTSKSQLLQAALNVEGKLLLPFATAVKLVLDYAAGNATLMLPAEFETIAEWLANRTAVLEYINRAQLNARANYDEALAAIQADESLVRLQPDSGTVVGRYYVDRTLGDRGVAQFTLNADKSGEWLERDLGGAFNWEITADGIVLNFGTPGMLIDNKPIAEFSRTETSTYLQQVTLTIVSGTEVSTQFAVERLQLSIAGALFGYQQIVKVSTESFKAFKQSAVVQATQLIELNTEYALPYAGVISSFSSEAYSYLYADSHLGTAKLRLVGEGASGGIAYFETADYVAPDSLALQHRNYPWQLNDTGQIVISLSETDYIEISAFQARESSDNPYVSVKAKLGDISRAISYAAAAQRAVVWNTQNVPGIYLLPVDPLEPNVLFWLELYEDGTALTVSTYDADSDGNLTPDEANKMPGYWQLDENGDLHVRRYRNIHRYCQATQWQPLAADDCQLYNNRTMKLYNLSDEKSDGKKDVSIIIDHRFYDSFLRGGDTGNAQLGYDVLSNGSYYNAIWQKVPERPTAIN